MKFKTKDQLAKHAIKYYLDFEESLEVSPASVPAAWLKNRACFVTLYSHGELRGCIGSCGAYEPLYQNVIHNAVAAAFSDRRFAPISLAEFPRLKYEVSVLSLLTKLLEKSPEKLLSYLSKSKPGVVLENNDRQALYLPQVWEQFSDSLDFLASLCLKAGLPENAWRDPSTNFWTFTVSH